MDIAQLRLDTRRSGRSNAGLVFAGLSLELNGTVFPHPDWSDFVVVVLSWWADGLSRMIRGPLAAPFQGRFMEGPFIIELAKLDSDKMTIHLIEDGRERRVIGKGSVSTSDFALGLLHTCDEVLQLCRDQNWWSSDADSLASATTNLRKAVRSP